MRIKWLAEKYDKCKKCTLHTRRTQVVHGFGNSEARLMLIGEAPGEQEDLKGFPFMGPSGERLNMMLNDVGLERSDIWITNVVLCRPVIDENDNRPPTDIEIKMCSHRMHTEILTVDPDLIVLFGATAVRALYGKKARRMEEMVGNMVKVTVPIAGTGHSAEFPAVVMYHPSHLLRVDAGWDPSGFSKLTTDHLRMAATLVDFVLLLREDPEAALSHAPPLPYRGEDIFLRKEL